MDQILEVPWKWDNGSEITIKFIEPGTPKVRNAIRKFAAKWLDYVNLKFKWVDSSDTDLHISFSDSGTLCVFLLIWTCKYEMLTEYQAHGHILGHTAIKCRKIKRPWTSAGSAIKPPIPNLREPPFMNSDMLLATSMNNSTLPLPMSESSSRPKVFWREVRLDSGRRKQRLQLFRPGWS